MRTTTNTNDWQTYNTCSTTGSTTNQPKNVTEQPLPKPDTSSDGQINSSTSRVASKTRTTTTPVSQPVITQNNIKPVVESIRDKAFHNMSLAKHSLTRAEMQSIIDNENKKTPELQNRILICNSHQTDIAAKIHQALESNTSKTYPFTFILILHNGTSWVTAKIRKEMTIDSNNVYVDYQDALNKSICPATLKKRISDQFKDSHHVYFRTTENSPKLSDVSESGYYALHSALHSIHHAYAHVSAWLNTSFEAAKKRITQLLLENAYFPKNGALPEKHDHIIAAENEGHKLSQQFIEKTLNKPLISHSPFYTLIYNCMYILKDYTARHAHPRSFFEKIISDLSKCKNEADLSLIQNDINDQLYRNVMNPLSQEEKQPLNKIIEVIKKREAETRNNAFNPSFKDKKSEKLVTEFCENYGTVITNVIAPNFYSWYGRQALLVMGKKISSLPDQHTETDYMVGKLLLLSRDPSLPEETKCNDMRMLISTFLKNKPAVPKPVPAKGYENAYHRVWLEITAKDYIADDSSFGINTLTSTSQTDEKKALNETALADQERKIAEHYQLDLAARAIHLLEDYINPRKIELNNNSNSFFNILSCKLSRLTKGSIDRRHIPEVSAALAFFKKKSA